MAIGTTWAGTYDFGAGRLHAPRTLERAQEIVAAAEQIRALGSRHSFNDLADSPGDLITVTELPAEVEVGEDGTATVAAGLTYASLAPELDRAGRALPTMASLPHITVAGAIATATHGSGDGAGTLAADVAGIELITHDGDLRWFDRSDPRFAGIPVSLGALGILTRVRLRTVPRFDISQRAVNDVPWQQVLEDFDGITGAAYSVSIFTSWRPEAVDQVWFKCRDGEMPGMFGGTAAPDHQHPVRGRDSENATRQLAIRGPWYDRLPHFRSGFTPSSGSEIQAEYLVDRRRAVDAIAALRGIASRLAPLVQVTEFRTIAADDLWLSSAYDRDTVGVHFTFIDDADAVRAVLPVMERTLEPFDARPHWGKWSTLGRRDIEHLYPRLGDFRRLVADLDPPGTFRNDYLDRLVL